MNCRVATAIESQTILTRQIETGLGPASARRLEALRLWQCQNIANAIAEFMPNWAVSILRDAPGIPTIVIQPEDFERTIVPTLFVHTDESAFHFEELCGDAYRKLGVYRRCADVVRAIRIRLIWEMATPPTFHRSIHETDGFHVH
jgi:hypothetical protein